MGKIVKLNPFISHKVWGGEKLHKIKNIEKPSEPIGETWEVSTLSEGSCLLGDMPLSNLCELSYLIKFIDTSDNLSIQVHPDNDYAVKNENSSGKTECWIILDAEEDSGIYLGFKKNVTKKEFFTAVKNGLDIRPFLNFIPVSKGDYFYIPAGAIHAIGKGITLCEVQESSGITYRVWDWNRVGLDGNPRELHVEKAKDVTNFSDEFNESIFNKIRKNTLDQVGISELIDHEKFNVQLFSNLTQKKMELTLKDRDSIVVLEGTVKGDIDLNTFEAGFVLESGTFNLDIEFRSSFLVVSGQSH
jgi:mannose-6-phosphate isomerase